MKKQTLAASIALLTAAVAPVAAEELTWNLVISPQGEGTYWLPAITFTEPALDATDALAFGPANLDVNVDLGKRSAPWQTVYAEGYWSNGNRGMDGNVTIVHGCALVVRGGLIIGTTGLSCPR